MKSFLLIDDHEILRSGVKNILLATFNPCEIHEAYDGKSAIIELKQRKYQLVIMDVQMPDTDSLGIMEFIRINSPGTNVLIFSMSPESAYAKRFLKAGAMGFVSKDAGITELKKAIDQVIHNRRYLSPALQEQFINELGSPVNVNPFDKLSTREFEIASLLISGSSSKEISKILSLQNSTTATYKARIFEKLQIKNILELSELSRIFNTSGAS